MSNKTIIENKLKELDLKLGIYDKNIDSLAKDGVNKIINNMEFGSTDVAVTVDEEKHIVEVYHVDDEVDFKIIMAEEYSHRYGRDFEEE